MLEVNPRLTTSYAGLRAALNVNPAALVLDLLGDGPHTLQVRGGQTVTVDLAK